MFDAIAIPLVSGYAANKPVSAFYRRAEAMDIPHFPTFGEVGTGGINTGSYYESKNGYRIIKVIRGGEVETASTLLSFASLMDEVQGGFGRTMSRLPEVFGVSRQTLYNWLSGGKTPKERYHEKIYELAYAAKVFKAAGFTPNSATLDKTVDKGKTFLELIGEGGSGEDAANRLLRIVKRGSEAKAKLDDILGNRKRPHLTASDFGIPHLDERS